MSVLLMLLVLLEIFAHFRDNAKFDSGEDFAVIPLRCYLEHTMGGCCFGFARLASPLAA